MGEISKSKRTEASKRIRKTNREHDLIKRRKLEEEVFEKLSISKALANIIIALEDHALNNPINTNTLIRNFEWLRLGMTETITSEDLADILSAGILDLLRRSFLLNDSLLDYELLWTLTNLTAILQPKEIEFLFGPEEGSKNQNAAKFIIQKLTSIIASSDDGQCKRLPLCCLSCWAICNILADSGEMRTQFLRYNILEHIIKLGALDEFADIEFLSIQAWLIGNILRNNNPPVHHSVSVKALPRLMNLLKTNVPSISTDIMRGLVSISEYSERVEILMAMGAGDYFLEILRKSEDETLINFTLTVIGNVISSSEVHCNAFLKAGLYNMLKQYIENKKYRGIVCWILANICSGEPNSFCFILTDEALMNKIMIYAIEAEWKIKQHALTVLLNILAECEKYQVLHLVTKFNLMSALCPGLRLHDNEYVSQVLKSLNRIYNILDTEDSDLMEKFKTEFDEENGELFLDSLSNHCPNEKIAAQAARLLENIQMNDTDNDM